MTDSRWTTETEELVARIVDRATRFDVDCAGPGEAKAATEEHAFAVLEALATAGVLLPPGGQTEPRFGRFMGEGWGLVEVLERAEATHQRTWTTWPDESEHFTPWVEVSPDA